tara:strand:- start:77 stop:709 length:633 start_codon:yes stop_codon:yes gene_type:complete
MRITLADLEGELVAFSGWQTGFKHNRTWTCLSNPYVCIWDKDSSVQDAIKQKVGHRFDHLWMSGDKRKNTPQQVKSFLKVGGVGVVRRYTRTNGTIDFTVKTPSNRWGIENFLDIYNDNFNKTSMKEKLELIEEGLEQVKSHRSDSEDILFGITKSVSTFEKELLEIQQELSSSIEITEKTLKTAKMKGKCKKIDQLIFPTRTNSKSKGF